MALRWRRGAPPRPLEAGVAVVGLFRDTRGVAQAARLLVGALERTGAPISRRDAGPPLGVSPVLDGPASDTEGAPNAATLVTCLNPPELLRWLDATGARELRGRRHIGYWAWELPDAPPSWAAAFRYVDEVWCHSEFAAAAVRKLAPRDTPVRVVHLPIFMTAFAPPDRARFGLPANTCVVLAAMDLRSTAARKNPQGALAAYVAAAPHPSEAALLVCKLSGQPEDAPDARAALETAAALRHDIRLFDSPLSETDMTSLTASADVVLSLHRAEGFGLLPAEAAWLGRPVVTTGWSAPVEFLDPTSSALISWTPTPVTDAQGLYGGAASLNATWAEPDIEEAATRLRELITSPDLRRTAGAAAAAHARRVFDPSAWTERVRQILAGAGDAG